MHRDNKVFVFVRQAEVRQLADLVPFARADKDDATRIGFTDHPNGFSVNGIQYDGRCRVLGFVQQLKSNFVRELRVVRRDLSPERIKFVREPRRVAGEFVEVMDVHDDVQAMLECPGDEEISFGINVVGQPEVGCVAGVMMPGDRQTDVVEAFGFDMDEI